MQLMVTITLVWWIISLTGRINMTLLKICSFFNTDADLHMLSFIVQLVVCISRCIPNVHITRWQSHKSKRKNPFIITRGVKVNATITH